MQVQERHVSELISMAYTAGLDSRKWEWFLARLSQVTGGLRVFAHVFDIRSNNGLAMIQHGFDPSYISSFSDYYNQLNPWAEKFPFVPVGRVIPSHKMVDPDALKRTEFYADWLKPQGDLCNSGGSILLNDADQVVAFGSCIRAKDVDKQEKPWLQLAQILVPHLQNAFKMNHQIGALGMENLIYREGMEPGTTALLALDRNGCLKYRNDRAAMLLENGDVLKTSGRGRVRFAQADADRALSGALYNIDTVMAQVAAPFFVTDRHGRSFSCRTIPFRNPDDLPLPLPSQVRMMETLLVLLTPCAIRAKIGPAATKLDNF